MFNHDKRKKQGWLFETNIAWRYCNYVNFESYTDDAEKKYFFIMQKNEENAAGVLSTC